MVIDKGGATLYGTSVAFGPADIKTVARLVRAEKGSNFSIELMEGTDTV